MDGNIVCEPTLHGGGRMIDNLQYALDGAWRVLFASLLFGAAFPAIFAIGVRPLAWAAGGDAEVSHARAHPSESCWCTDSR
jgi:hypothetical protein